MTTLVMVGILFFGIVAYRSLPGERPAQRRLSDDHGHRAAARGEPRDDGRDRRHAAREAVLDHRRHRQHDVDDRASARRRSSCSSSLDRNIDAAAQDVQAAITQTLRTLPQGIMPPVVPEDQSRRRADPHPGPDIGRRCRSPRSTNTARRRWPSDCRWSAAWPRSWSRGRRSTPCASSSTRRQLASRGLGLEDVNSAISGAERQLRDRHPVGQRQSALTIEATGQLDNAADFRHHDRRLSQRRARAT